MLEKKTDLLTIYQFKNLSQFSEISHFVSTRVEGISKPPYDSLNLGFNVGDNPKNVLKNLKLLASALRISLNKFTTAQQIHENNITVVTKKFRGKGATDYKTAIPATDALVTNIPDLCLMVTVADCVPIILYDPKTAAVGTIHAGRKGTLKLIAQNTVNLLRKDFSTTTKDLIVGIGPSIGPCCYEVGSNTHFNLWETNKTQLIQSGVLEENIEIAEICTKCHVDQFFSARAAQEAAHGNASNGKTGRFGAGIMIKCGVKYAEVTRS